MKRLLMLVVLVVLLGGGGGAGWWFFLREDPAEMTAGAQMAENGAEDEANKRLKRFLELEPIMLPIIREGQVILHVTVVTAVEMEKPVDPRDVRDMTLQLRDAFFSELHAIYALRYVQERGYDLPIVTERLLQSGQRVLGAGSLRAVTIRNLHKRVPVTG